MSKWKFEYLRNRRKTPISYWVHKGVGEQINGYVWCKEFEPPFPKKKPTKGFPFLTVTVKGLEIEFASSYEIKHFLEVMEQKNLPTTRYLSNLRGTGYGPNNHWLSRFPSHLKSWAKREKIIDSVKRAKKSLDASGADF
ncbi:MAG: hypothetical protein ABJH06_07110 [Paraglaciecola sp.]|uniref:hypothetical protein n=1 Tax=Paraglaciecola sp. TaxID=1920173 RepID=UPI003296835C